MGVQSSTFTVSVDGLQKTHKALLQLDDGFDAEIKQAMTEAGAIIQKEALRLVPKRSGALARSIRVSKARNKLTVSAGDNKKLRYAYTFHAIAMGKSRGGFTFKVPAGKHGKAYKRQARIPNNPFLFTAATRKRDEVERAYIHAIDELIRKATP